MAALAHSSAFLAGKRVNVMDSIRGFGAKVTRGNTVPSPPSPPPVSAIFTRKEGAAADRRGKIKAEALQVVQQTNSFGQTRPVANMTALELWRKAEKARMTAKRMTTFAALSLNGAAFAQLQTNAKVSALWDEVESLEEAAIKAYELEQATAQRAASEDRPL